MSKRKNGIKLFEILWSIKVCFILKIKVWSFIFCLLSLFVIDEIFFGIVPDGFKLAKSQSVKQGHAEATWHEI